LNKSAARQILVNVIAPGYTEKARFGRRIAAAALPFGFGQSNFDQAANCL